MLEVARQVKRAGKLTEPGNHCVVIPYWEAKHMLHIVEDLALEKCRRTENKMGKCMDAVVRDQCLTCRARAAIKRGGANG